MVFLIFYRLYICKLCYYVIIVLFIIIMSFDYVYDVFVLLIRRVLYFLFVIIIFVFYVLINCFMYKGLINIILSFLDNI